MNNIYDCIKDKYPKLEVGDRWGGTGYIDYISWKEVTSPIMYGADCKNRPFFVIKFRVNDKIFMETFFQRYADYNNLWMGCGHAARLITHTDGGLNDNQANFLNNAILGKNLKVNDDNANLYRLDSTIKDDEYVKIMSNEEVNETINVCPFYNFFDAFKKKSCS